MKPLRGGDRKLWPDELGLVARGAGHSFVLQGIGLGLGYVVHVLFARWLGALEYGVYTYVLAWIGLLAVLASTGIPMLVVRFVPEYRVGRQWALLRGLIRWSSLHILAVGTGLVLLGMVLVWWFDDELAGAYASAFYVGLWIVPLQALLSVAGGMYRGFHRIGRAYVSPVLRHSLSLLLVFVLWWSGTSLTSVHVLGAALAAAVLVLAYQAEGLRRGIPPAAKKASPSYKTRTWLHVATPLLLVGSFLMVLHQADILMVGAWLGPLEAGLYRAASRTAALGSIVPVAVSAAAEPMIARLYAEGDRDRLQRLASVVVRWATGASAGVAVVFVIVGRFVLALFGEAFVAAYGVLVILAIGQVGNAAVGIAAGLLNLTGHQKTGMFIFGGCALLNIVFNAVGIMLWGSLGAAVATTLSFVLKSALLWQLARKKVEVDASIVYALQRKRPPYIP